MAIFMINGNKVVKNKLNKFRNEKELQSLFEKNLEEIFGIRFLTSEFSTTNKGRIDTLGLDDNNSPVIIEYKEDEKDNVINQGLFYLDWLIDHKGDFEILVQNKLGKNIKVNWDEPRLILVAKSYNEYDKYAVNRISGNIELWRYVLYEGNVLSVERINLSPSEKKEMQKRTSKPIVAEYNYDQHFSGSYKNMKSIYDKLKEEILKLDENIQERIKKHYIAFTLNRNFAEVTVQANALKIYIDIKKNQLSDPKNIVEDQSNIGHYGTGDCMFKVSIIDEIEYAISLIKQAYESKL